MSAGTVVCPVCGATKKNPDPLFGKEGFRYLKPTAPVVGGSDEVLKRRARARSIMKQNAQRAA